MDAEFSKNLSEIVTTNPIRKANEIAYHDCFIFHHIKSLVNSPHAL